MYIRLELGLNNEKQNHIQIILLWQNLFIALKSALTLTPGTSNGSKKIFEPSFSEDEKRCAII